MPKLGVIKLYINPKDYQAETGKRLTKRQLTEYGSQANDDFAGVYGYEAWTAEFEDVEEKK